MAGPGLDRTGTLTPRQTRGYCNPAPPILGNIGGLAVTTPTVTTAETLLWRSELIPADVLNHSFNFMIDLMGIFGSDGSDDVTFTLDAVEPDGTRTEICKVASTGLSDVDDLLFHLTLMGRVTLEQVTTTDGKFWAGGHLICAEATQVVDAGEAAIAGVAVTFTAGVHFEISGLWDSADTGTDLNILSAMMSVCNVPGGPGIGAAY